MEPLYTAETTYTIEEYKKFNKKLLTNKIIILFSVLFVFSIAASLLLNNLLLLIIESIFIIITGIAFIIIQNQAVKKVYYCDKHLQKNSLYKYSFYQFYFEIKTNNAFVKFNYEDIYSVIESKTNFYIMKSVNQGYIIAKEKCSPELAEFISKLKNK